ncbi:MAG: ABC transporter permease subunit [Planctomycetota bacterium]|jgi:ABC-type transport system involved in multi-copper enzyme maturation permease subunit
MPAFLNWLLRLLPTNPICMRLVQGGSRRHRHLLIRSGYLAVMVFVLLFALLGKSAGAASVRELATAGAQTFTSISYLQVGLICLLTPIFMAGAIAQEANPRTWDILLTTPLGNLQIVLGNLFGRLFFILALLFSTLPLFAVTQYFGGVPGKSIFSSYAIASSSGLLVAAIAITLCVNRTAGRRAVFWFYAAVIMYLFATYAADLQLRQPVSLGATAKMTTLATPLNPFLALEVLLRSNTYMPHDLTGTGAAWIERMWLSRPIATFCWLCVGLSVVMVAYSTLRVRMIGSAAGSVSWHRRVLGLGARGAVERPARRVGHNPIAWRESVARGKTLGAIVARWGFVALGVAVGLAVVGLYHTGSWTGATLQLALVTVLAAEIVVVVLVALNMSATAVSREREDGTLDLILSTPIQPGPYLAGKLRGLIQYLLPLMLVPVATMLIVAVYVLADGFGRSGGVWMTGVPLKGTTDTADLPVVLPEGAITLPLVLIPFVAFCVMVGLHWSIKSKGTIGSVVAAVLVVGAVAGVLGLCGLPAGLEMQIVGALVSAMSPLNLLWAIVYPAATIPKSLSDPVAGRFSLVAGAAIAGAVYTAVVYGMHTTMRRSFMMTVRKLAGAT